MFGIPEGCSRSSCTVYAQWTPVTSDTLEFEMEGTTPGWLAIGVSADRVMGTDGIDDVFACQRDNATDIVYAQDTYNPQSPRGNIIDSVSVMLIIWIRMAINITSKLCLLLHFTPTLRTKLDSS